MRQKMGSFFDNPNGVVIIQPRVGVATPTLGIRLKEEQPCKGRISAALFTMLN